MNFSVIKRVLGWLLVFEAFFFLVPLVTAAIYWEEEFFSFLISIAISGGLGGLCVWKRPKNTSIYAKEGFVIVAMSWIVMSLVGALPFFFSGAIPNYIDALFETVSGFTTTGASILNGAWFHPLGGRYGRSRLYHGVSPFERRKKYAHHESGKPRSDRQQARPESA